VVVDMLESISCGQILFLQEILQQLAVATAYNGLFEFLGMMG